MMQITGDASTEAQAGIAPQDKNIQRWYKNKGFP